MSSGKDRLFAGRYFLFSKRVLLFYIYLTLVLFTYGASAEDAEALPDDLDFPDDYNFDDIPEYETKVESVSIAPSSSSKTITQKEIAEVNAASADKLMQLVPGVEIVQHGSEGKAHQIMLRGFDAAHGSDVEVTLEGVSLNEPSQVHGQGYIDLYGIIPEVVSQIDVHMGPFLPFQGNFATGGTLNFRLKVPGHFDVLTLKTEVDNYGKWRSLTVFSPVSKDSFIAADIVTDPGYAPGREAQRGTLLAQLKENIKNGVDLKFLFSAQTARFETPGTVKLSEYENGEMDFYDVHTPYGKGLSDRVFGRAGVVIDKNSTNLEGFIYAMGRDFSLEENYTGWLFDEESGDRKRQEQKGGVFGGDVDLEQKLDLKIKTIITAGAGWRLDKFRQRESGVANNGDILHINRNNEISINQLHLYGGIKIAPLSWLEIYPSVRFDGGFYDVKDLETTQKGNQNFYAVSPRAALSFPFSEKFMMFADYGRGFRMPEARSILYGDSDTSDEDLKIYKGGSPDVSICDTVEAGFHIAPKNWLTFKLTGFGVWMEKEMTFDHVSNITIEQDGTRRLGSEADIALSPVSWLRMDANVIYVNTRFNRSGNPIPNVPTLMGTAAIKAGEVTNGAHGGFDIFWMGAHNLAHGAVTSGYAKLSVDGGYKFKRFDVTAVIDNLLNSKNMEGTYHFASWFNTDSSRSMIPEIQYIAGNPFTLRLIFTVLI